MRSLLASMAIWAASIIPAVAEPETSTSTLEERLAEIRRSPRTHRRRLRPLRSPPNTPRSKLLRAPTRSAGGRSWRPR